MCARLRLRARVCECMCVCVHVSVRVSRFVYNAYSLNVLIHKVYFVKNYEQELQVRNILNSFPVDYT